MKYFTAKRLLGNPTLPRGTLLPLYSALRTRLTSPQRERGASPHATTNVPHRPRATRSRTRARARGRAPAPASKVVFFLNFQLRFSFYIAHQPTHRHNGGAPGPMSQKNGKKRKKMPPRKKEEPYRLRPLKMRQIARATTLVLAEKKTWYS